MNVVDLSLPVSNDLAGVEITTAKTRETDGWNATTLSMYSHSGTHMDAPRHFLAEGNSLDQQDLNVCVGRATVIDLTPVQPSQLLRIEDFKPFEDRVTRGARLLLRTDWSDRFGTPEYRNQLPRISAELAEWFVERGVALLGVEPPSVADVNCLPEVTEVHEILLGGGVLIVEGLRGLKRLKTHTVEFIALPLNIVGGDGCPVRAIAIEREVS